MENTAKLSVEETFNALEHFAYIELYIVGWLELKNTIIIYIVHGSYCSETAKILPSKEEFLLEFVNK